MPLTTFAQSLGPPDPPGTGSIYEFIQILLGVITKLAIPILAVLLVYWGYKFASAMGNDAEIAEAKKNFSKMILIVGFFLALAVIATIIYNVGKSIGFPVLF